VGFRALGFFALKAKAGGCHQILTGRRSQSRVCSTAYISTFAVERSVEKKSDPQNIASQIANYAFDAVQTVPDLAQQERIFNELGSQFSEYAKLLATERKKSPEQIAADGEATRNKLLKIARREAPDAKPDRQGSAAAEIKRRECRHGSYSHSGYKRG
jgi:hypothetical protein